MNNASTITWCSGLLVICLALTAARAQEAEPVADTADTPQPRVAVFPFIAQDPGNDELGTEIASLVAGLMAGESGFEMVDRAELDRVLSEQAAGQAGLMDQNRLVSVGKLVSADLIVTGRVFALGQSMMLTAKVISVRTSLLDAVVVRGKPNELDELTVKAAAGLSDKIREEGRRLMGVADEPVDPLPLLMRALRAHDDTPRVAVVILEERLGANAGPGDAGLDPVIETEVKRSLIESGVRVFDVQTNQLADWADFKATDVNSWPRSLARVDLLIVGEAYSEVGIRIGQLVSASARGEVNVIDRKDGRIVLSERSNGRGVGVSPRQAGTEALTRVGHELSVLVLNRLLERAEARADAAANADQDGAATEGSGTAE